MKGFSKTDITGKRITEDFVVEDTNTNSHYVLSGRFNNYKSYQITRTSVIGELESFDTIPDNSLEYIGGKEKEGKWITAPREFENDDYNMYALFKDNLNYEERSISGKEQAELEEIAVQAMQNQNMVESIDRAYQEFKDQDGRRSLPL